MGIKDRIANDWKCLFSLRQADSRKIYYLLPCYEILGWREDTEVWLCRGALGTRLESTFVDSMLPVKWTYFEEITLDEADMD